MMMNPFVALISTVLNLFWWAIMIWFVLSLLIQFDMVNRYNPVVNRVFTALESLIEPLLRPIRKVVPIIGGFDLSPLVLILGLRFIQNSLIYYSF